MNDLKKIIIQHRKWKKSFKDTQIEILSYFSPFSSVLVTFPVIYL